MIFTALNTILVVFPILVFLVDTSTLAGEFNTSEDLLSGSTGTAIGIYIVGGFISVVVGYLANIIQRLHLFSIIVFCGELACLATYWTTTYTGLYFCQVLTGISIVGATSVMLSLFTDLYVDGSRAKVNTLVGLSLCLGIASGQILPGLLGPDLGWRLPFLMFASAALLLALIIAKLQKPESTGQKRSAKQLSANHHPDDLPSSLAPVDNDNSSKIDLRHVQPEENHKLMEPIDASANSTPKSAAQSEEKTSGADILSSGMAVQNAVDATVPSSSSSLTNMSKDPSVWIQKGKKLNGTHYILTGSEEAELIVTVHGLGDYNVCYDRFVEQMKDDYRILQYDLIGRGFSDNPTNSYDGTAHVTQLYTLLSGLNLLQKPFHLVGISMGGALSALYASKYIEQIKSLTLLAPAGLMNSLPTLMIRRMGLMHGQIKRYFKDHLEHNFRHEFYRLNGHPSPHEDEVVASIMLAYRHNPHQFESYWQCLLQFPVYGLKSSVSIIAQTKNLPVYVIWGDKDELVHFKPNYHRWMSLLGKGSCKVIATVFPNVGHVPMAECPEVTIPVIRKFLNSVQ